MENNFLKTGGEIKNTVEPKPISQSSFAHVENNEIEKFNDLSGVTLGKMNVGLWYVENKQNLKKLVIILLVIISTFFWGYVVYNLVYYYTVGIRNDEKMIQAFVANKVINNDYTKENSAKELIPQSTRILSNGQNKYDFVVRVYNPNSDFSAEFNYDFFVDAEKVDSARGFIFPQETKYVSFLAKEFKVKPSRARVEINDVLWKRVDKHQIEEWDKFKKDHLNFVISGIKLQLDEQNNSSVMAVNHLDFDVVNRTAYNYYQVDFNILLMRGDNVVGITRYGLPEFMSMSSKHVNFVWLGDLDPSANLVITPEVNVLDNKVYMDFNGNVDNYPDVSE